jgi:hypothetical protein
MKNLLKISYIALQGVFLPLILILADSDGLTFWLLFLLYEGLTIFDSLLYWKIFSKEKR